MRTIVKDGFYWGPDGVKWIDYNSLEPELEQELLKVTILADHGGSYPHTFTYKKWFYKLAPYEYKKYLVSRDICYKYLVCEDTYSVFTLDFNSYDKFIIHSILNDFDTDLKELLK